MKIGVSMMTIAKDYYRDTLEIDIGRLEGVTGAKKPKRLPVVLSRDKVNSILASMEGTPRLVASLLYGAGLRLLDGLRLRVQDFDFAAGELLVRDSKGVKDRRTMLPRSLVPVLESHL